MSEKWRSVGACPNCGAPVDINGDLGSCKFCMSNLEKVGVSVLDLPSDFPPDDFKNEVETSPDKDRQRVKRIIESLFPNPQILVDPEKLFREDDQFAFKVQDVPGWHYLVDMTDGIGPEDLSPTLLSHLIDRAFEKAQDDFEATMNQEIKSEPTSSYEEGLQYRYMIVMRLLKWLQANHQFVEQVMTKAADKMISTTLVEQGRNRRNQMDYTRKDIAPIARLRDGYNPEALVELHLLSCRENMADTFNTYALTPTEAFYWRGGEFHPHLLEHYLANIDRFPDVHKAELKKLLIELNDTSLFPEVHSERRFTNKTEPQPKIEDRNSFQGKDNMSRTDRLLEILWDPRVYPFALELAKELRELVKMNEQSGTGDNSGNKGERTFLRNLRKKLGW